MQLSTPVLGAGYYQLLLKPELIAQGATRCDAYEPRMPKEMPHDCDIAVRSSHGDILEERYFGSYGMKSTTVRAHDGRWLSTSTSYRLNQVLLIFPVSAFFVAVIAVVRKMVRTHAVWSWQLARHPADQFEQMLWFYLVPIFLLGIGMIGAAQLAA